MAQVPQPQAVTFQTPGTGSYASTYVFNYTATRVWAWAVNSDNSVNGGATALQPGEGGYLNVPKGTAPAGVVVSLGTAVAPPAGGFTTPLYLWCAVPTTWVTPVPAPGSGGPPAGLPTGGMLSGVVTGPPSLWNVTLAFQGSSPMAFSLSVFGTPVVSVKPVPATVVVQTSALAIAGPAVAIGVLVLAAIAVALVASHKHHGPAAP